MRSAGLLATFPTYGSNPAERVASEVCDLTAPCGNGETEPGTPVTGSRPPAAGEGLTPHLRSGLGFVPAPLPKNLARLSRPFISQTTRDTSVLRCLLQAASRAVVSRYRLLVATLSLSLFWVGLPLQAEGPQRIISTAPSITEMLYSLGLGDRVVGVTEFCHYPPEVRRKSKIGSYLHPNLETILAMKPDLVVVLKEHGELAGRLRNIKLDVFELQHNDLAGVYDSMLLIGRRTGIVAVAEEKVRKIREALEEIESQAAGRPRRGVMFVVGRTPGTIQDLMVVGRGSFLNELIAIAGGRNVFGGASSYYPRIPREEVYAKRPDVIIDMGDMGDTDQATEQYTRSVTKLWKRIPGLPAVDSGRVYSVAEDVFVVPGPRVVEAARLLLRMIHPEAADTNGATP